MVVRSTQSSRSPPGCCKHCGTELRPAQTDFCCSGCALVFQILSDRGWADYYRIRELTGNESRALIDSGRTRYDYLDSESYWVHSRADRAGWQSRRKRSETAHDAAVIVPQRRRAACNLAGRPARAILSYGRSRRLETHAALSGRVSAWHGGERPAESS